MRVSDTQFVSAGDKVLGSLANNSLNAVKVSVVSSTFILVSFLTALLHFKKEAQHLQTTRRYPNTSSSVVSKTEGSHS